MAIQFPNFLSVPNNKPDYSGISDIFENYYAGKAMPQNDLIRAVQAEFARPNAEQNLLSTKLSNRKSQMDMDKMAQDMAEQAAFEKKLSQALSANQLPARNAGQGGLPLPPIRNSQPIGANPSQTSRVAGISGVNIVGADSNADAGFDPSKMEPRFRKFDQMANGLPNDANTFDTKLSNDEESKFKKWKEKYAPNDSGKDYDLRGAFKAGLTPDIKTGHWPDTFKKPNHPTFSNQSIYAAQAPQLAGSWQGENYIKPKPSEPELDEIVISKGSPHLAGVDQMYDSDPRSRAFLEKKGFKKTQEIKFDNKTGRTTILTKYPSGTVTTKTYGGAAAAGEGGIPLTNKMISAHQEKIAAIDNALPALETILEKPKTWAGKIQQFPRSSGWLPGMGYVPGFMGESASYEAKVNSVIDTLMKAYGLPSTHEGLETIRKQLLIEHGETDAHYKRRLKDFIKDLKLRKAYSENEVKKSHKIAPIDASSGSGETYSSNDYEVVNE